MKPAGHTSKHVHPRTLSHKGATGESTLSPPAAPQGTSPAHPCAAWCHRHWPAPLCMAGRPKAADNVVLPRSGEAEPGASRVNRACRSPALYGVALGPCCCVRTAEAMNAGHVTNRPSTGVGAGLARTVKPHGCSPALKEPGDGLPLFPLVGTCLALPGTVGGIHRQLSHTEPYVLRVLSGFAMVNE